MSTNAELARIFDEIAQMLQVTGANSFRVSSYARVARAIRELTVDIATIAHDKPALVAIEGIGDSSASKIREYVDSGAIADHAALLEKVPRGLLDVMAIPGIGPKTARTLWESGGVTDIPSLKAALDAGTLEGLARMGEKTIANIRKAIAFTETLSGRTPLGKALPIAESMVARLRSAVRGARVEYSGSLRRGRETIGDIDLVATTRRAAALAEAFRSMPDVVQVLVSGETKSSVRIGAGMQVDLRVVDKEAFGAALLYFTGSKDHNVILRERAIKRGFRLNEYGLFPDDGEDEPPQQRGVRPVAGETEASIYEALDLPWMPPELREDRGEFTSPMPDLVTIDDIGSELHAHTTASDGRLSIEELALAAKRRGLHTIAVTDHSRSSVLAGGLDEDRLRAHVEAIRAADARIDGITILAGAEVDILIDGSLDYDDDLLAELDIVIASPHASLNQDSRTATERLVRAIRHPLTHVIGHPTGRVVNAREGLAPDLAAVIQAAAETGTALEVNANYRRLDLRDTHVRAAVAAGVRIAINTDVHSEVDFDQLRYGVMTARRGWLTRDLCVNAWDAARLREWLRR